MASSISCGAPKFTWARDKSRTFRFIKKVTAGRLRCLYMISRLAVCSILLGLLVPAAAQVIEYETGGVKHQTLTRSDVTVMFAVTKTHVKDYAMIQVSIANGSQLYSNVNPEDFAFEHG